MAGLPFSEHILSATALLPVLRYLETKFGRGIAVFCSYTPQILLSPGLFNGAAALCKTAQCISKPFRVTYSKLRPVFKGS